MTTPRMVVVLVGLAIIGIAVVAIRVDQARVSARIQGLESEALELNREIGRQEMEIARLRAPQAIREQAERLGLPGAPRERPATPGPTTRRVNQPRRSGGD